MLLEEVLEELAALIGAHARHHLGPVIEPAVSYDVPERPNRAGLLIYRTEHNTCDTGVHNGSCAHRARLKRDDERAAFKPPLAHCLGGFAHGDNLGVRCGIAEQFTFIAPTADDVAHWVEDDCTNRHIIASSARFEQCEMHRCFVCGARFHVLILTVFLAAGNDSLASCAHTLPTIR